jgi:hypothetical protein
MIIRLSFGDNDITNYFEDFCKGLRNVMFTPERKSYEIERDSFDSVEAYCEALNKAWDAEKALEKTRYHLMNPDNHFRKGSKEHKQIQEEVLRLWRKFAPKVEMEDWGDPKVSIQYELKEQWENGEATYYWTAYDVCITQ